MTIEILGHRMDALQFLTPFLDCRFVLRCSLIAVKFAVKLRSRRKTSELGGFGPQLLREGNTLNFQIAITFEHVVGFGRVSLIELRG